MRDAKRGKLTNALVLLFTDNSTVESAIAKGNSPSEYSFELILELRQAQFVYRFGSHAIHVSGNRMTHQGTDGVSRGDLLQAGKSITPIRCYAPIHLTGRERYPNLES